MDHNNMITKFDESKYLISMAPVEKVLEAGYYLNLNDQSNVLDLCCGYGEMLKLWGEAYGINGKGVDICDEFIKKGNERLEQSNLNHKIDLVCQDVKEFKTDEQYDVACLIGEVIFGDVSGTIQALDPFLKEGGKIVIGEPYYKQKDVPQALIEFEGDLLTLEGLYDTFKRSGYYVSYMAGCTDNEWERYISWSARRDLEWLRSHPKDKGFDNKEKWIDTWYKMYFNYRRPYEGWALFILEKI
ncbi:Methyltransferase domain-containing protein [Alkalibacterium subtropicum]|uniref:Methyltransferase domain-containing protein n=1 Tax=Alkalibacterium subtropicum TaxID=753702 RepID=A0A1I1HJK7_9LACT|nr:class I SAM-dependent methyltransferase [Alkalibacterium subtropicum]SFC24329.1 Methyltransferase domain-containing protein [Alkalibacterium subtropicum]